MRWTEHDLVNEFKPGAGALLSAQRPAGLADDGVNGEHQAAEDEDSHQPDGGGAQAGDDGSADGGHADDDGSQHLDGGGKAVLHDAGPSFLARAYIEAGVNVLVKLFTPSFVAALLRRMAASLEAGDVGGSIAHLDRIADTQEGEGEDVEVR